MLNNNRNSFNAFKALKLVAITLLVCTFTALIEPQFYAHSAIALALFAPILLLIISVQWLFDRPLRKWIFQWSRSQTVVDLISLLVAHLVLPAMAILILTQLTDIFVLTEWIWLRVPAYTIGFSMLLSLIPEPEK